MTTFFCWNRRVLLGLKVLLSLWNPMEKLWFCKSCASGRCWLCVTLLLCCLSGFLRIACLKSSSYLGDGLWQQWLPDADQQLGAAAAHMCRVGTLGFAPGFPFGGLERGKKGFSWMCSEQGGSSYPAAQLTVQPGTSQPAASVAVSPCTHTAYRAY